MYPQTLSTRILPITSSTSHATPQIKMAQIPDPCPARPAERKGRSPQPPITRSLKAVTTKAETAIEPVLASRQWQTEIRQI